MKLNARGNTYTLGTRFDVYEWDSNYVTLITEQSSRVITLRVYEFLRSSTTGFPFRNYFVRGFATANVRALQRRTGPTVVSLGYAVHDPRMARNEWPTI